MFGFMLAVEHEVDGDTYKFQIDIGCVVTVYQASVTEHGQIVHWYKLGMMVTEGETDPDVLMGYAVEQGLLVPAS